MKLLQLRLWIGEVRPSRRQQRKNSKACEFNVYGFSIDGLCIGTEEFGQDHPSCFSGRLQDRDSVNGYQMYQVAVASMLSFDEETRRAKHTGYDTDQRKPKWSSSS